jgi:hypothetical protein
MLIAVSLLAACAQSHPSRFYTLTSDPGEQGAAAVPAAGLAVGLGPVILPKYLDRPDIVQRTSTHELSLAEFDKWSEPLDSMVPRVMSENLSALLGTNQVFVLPQRRTPRLDYEVEVEILRFDAGADGEVVLDVQWEVYGGAGDKPLDIQRSAFREPVSGEGYPAIAAAMSRALGRFSADIAAAIRSADQTRKTPPRRR